MTTYFEYGVNLTDNQKRSLASAMNNKTPLTLRIKNYNVKGNDELMLTKTQLGRIQKSLAGGTGVDIKISKTQIRKVAKHGGIFSHHLQAMEQGYYPSLQKDFQKLFQHWQLVLFLHLDVWELITFLEKELIFPKSTFQCCQ